MQFVKDKPKKKRAIGVKKVTTSLPPSVVADLDLISGSMGLSRSAFLSALLTQSLPPLRDSVLSMGGSVGDSSSPESMALQQRYNAHSKASIDKFIHDVVFGGSQHDLFDKG